jgi:hypothetical protein
MLDGFAEFVKTGSSVMRSAVKVRRNMSAPEHLRVYEMTLKGKPIGSLKAEKRYTSPHDWRVIDSEVAEKFRGMGLGKKMYGEVMKDMPGGNLASDRSLSNAAEKIWKSMGDKPGYTLAKGKQRRSKTSFIIAGKGGIPIRGVTSTNSEPLYRAKITKKAEGAEDPGSKDLIIKELMRKKKMRKTALDMNDLKKKTRLGYYLYVDKPARKAAKLSRRKAKKIKTSIKGLTSAIKRKVSHAH